MNFVAAVTKDVVTHVKNVYLYDLILKKISLEGLGLVLGISVVFIVSNLLKFFFNVLYNPGYSFSLISNGYFHLIQEDGHVFSKF